MLGVEPSWAPRPARWSLATARHRAGRRWRWSTACACRRPRPPWRACRRPVIGDRGWRMAGLQRVAVTAAIYSAARTEARPPQVRRLPVAATTVLVQGRHPRQGGHLPAIEASPVRAAPPTTCAPPPDRCRAWSAANPPSPARPEGQAGSGPARDRGRSAAGSARRHGHPGPDASGARGWVAAFARRFASPAAVAAGPGAPPIPAPPPPAAGAAAVAPAPQTGPGPGHPAHRSWPVGRWRRAKSRTWRGLTTAAGDAGGHQRRRHRGFISAGGLEDDPPRRPGARGRRPGPRSPPRHRRKALHALLAAHGPHQATLWPRQCQSTAHPGGALVLLRSWRRPHAALPCLMRALRSAGPGNRSGSGGATAGPHHALLRSRRDLGGTRADPAGAGWVRPRPRTDARRPTIRRRRSWNIQGGAAIALLDSLLPARMGRRVGDEGNLWEKGRQCGSSRAGDLRLDTTHAHGRLPNRTRRMEEMSGWRARWLREKPVAAS